MPVHEAWVLGALIMAIGLILGNLAGQWWTRSHPDADLLDDTYDRGWDDAMRRWNIYDDRDLGQSDGRTAAGSAEQEAPTGREGVEADELLPPLAAGHTYSELTALADRDELEAISQPLPPVDPDWHPAFLARSEAWLADTRAELGLVAA